MGSTAAGMGALGFWIFVAAVVVAGIWYDVRRRESQQETLRRVVESGKALDRDVLDRILATGGNKDLARDLSISSLILFSLAPGLAILGWFLRAVAAEAMTALFGVSILVGFLGAGLWLAARLVERGYPENKG